MKSAGRLSKRVHDMVGEILRSAGWVSTGRGPHDIRFFVITTTGSYEVFTSGISRGTCPKDSEQVLPASFVGAIVSGIRTDGETLGILLNEKRAIQLALEFPPIDGLSQIIMRFFEPAEFEEWKEFYNASMEPIPSLTPQ